MKSLLLILSLIVATSYATNHTNNSDISSGSGSEFVNLCMHRILLLSCINIVSCSDIICTGGGYCVEEMGGPRCKCPDGKRSDSDYHCEGK